MQANLHSPDLRPIELMLEHADLDVRIDAAALAPLFDDLALRRMKMRRLALRDEMQCPRDLLQPDAPA